MKEKSLDHHLAQLRQSHLPSCPDTVIASVLRRIREKEGDSSNDGVLSLAHLTRLALRPGIAAALLATVLSLGVITTSVASQATFLTEKPKDTIGLEIIANPHTLECHHVHKARTNR
ncbi:MAG: hypothetical protein JJT75_09865 [Opitutales bacterium]|nr:hypothetical protein [Opitutales bacterium]MCH8541080.1 hypothetical protein [Opitutales bacterium]